MTLKWTQNSAQWTQKFSSMDAKFTAIDAKMDKQFSTIMAFIAVGRLPGGFSEKIEAAPSPDAVSSP